MHGRLGLLCSAATLLCFATFNVCVREKTRTLSGTKFGEDQHCIAVRQRFIWTFVTDILCQKNRVHREDTFYLLNYDQTLFFHDLQKFHFNQPKFTFRRIELKPDPFFEKENGDNINNCNYFVINNKFKNLM